MPEDVHVSYRLIDQGRVVERSMFEGNALEWTKTPEHQYGTTNIVVPPAAVLHCFASYRGIAQHFGWISDPTAMQNPKRSVYNKFDDKLEILTDFLTKSGSKGRDARDLETGVAWLLWMLGFSVAHLGGTGRTQDAADLIATTPNGHFAVIECTTGLLKAENKLPLLVSRVEQVRLGVVASNNRHLRVLPIIVTSKTRADVSADIEQAERLGVLVLTSENLEQAIASTLVLPNPEKMYDDLWEIVEAARLKLQTQGSAHVS
jgi:Holliday junction resolvase